MKKIIALVLAAMMCFPMAACGSNSAEEIPPVGEQQPSGTQIGQTPETTTTAPVQSNAETTAESEPETKAPETTAKDEPAFDTGWASNEFEALLPKLPFDGWTKKQKSSSVYKMELGGLKDSVITDSSGKTVGYGEDKETMIAYLEALKGYGFSVEETGGIEGYAYQWLVTDPSGNEIEVTCAEGFCWITITKKT